MQDPVGSDDARKVERHTAGYVASTPAPTNEAVHHYGANVPANISAPEERAAAYRDESKLRSYAAAASSPSSPGRFPISEDSEHPRTPKNHSGDGRSIGYNQNRSSTSRQWNPSEQSRPSDPHWSPTSVSPSFSYHKPSDHRSGGRHDTWYQTGDQNLGHLRADYQKQLHTFQKELDDLKTIVKQGQHRERELQTNVQQERQRANVLEQNLRGLEARHAETTELSRTRGVELQAARTYLSKADLITPVDVIQMADALNQEIFQASAFISDSVLSGASRTSDKSSSVRGESAGGLLRHISESRERCDRVGEQLACQAVLVRVATNAMSKWSDDSNVNTFVERVLDAMSSQEESSICGKWRALAHRYNPELSNKDDNEAGLLRAMKLKLLVASQDMGYHQNPFKAAGREVSENYEDKLRAVVSKTVALRDAIHRSITSEHIRVVVFEPGHAFLPSSMTNEYESDMSGVKGDKVLATTAIGLMMSEPAKLGEDGARIWLLKPKVVLESLLKEL